MGINLKVTPTRFSNPIVDVQPMILPTNIIFYLDFAYGTRNKYIDISGIIYQKLSTDSDWVREIQYPLIKITSRLRKV